jgi:hypothetical protein
MKIERVVTDFVDPTTAIKGGCYEDALCKVYICAYDGTDTFFVALSTGYTVCVEDMKPIRRVNMVAREEPKA